MNRQRTFAVLILLAVAALVAVEFFGFQNANFFRRDLWYPDGPWHFLQFTGIYIACATAILILVPWLFASLCAAALVLLTAIVLGPLALFAVLLFLASAFCLGSLLLRREDPLLSTLLGASIYIFAMSFAARLPIHYSAIHAAVLA